jgi:UDP-N-acetylglucosamine--N-acetylmuramyl-(pentapeptide) pyrophosphoryl-undecaprenol N-acetylglucosamine transferase
LDLSPGNEVLLVGARRPLDRKLLAASGLPHRLVPAGGLMGKTSADRLRSMGLLATGVMQSFGILLGFRPHVVLGAGGYVSAPAVLAARCLGRPIVLMEQNARPGAANRWLAGFAKAVALGFPEARKHFLSELCVETGIPLRPEVVALASGDPPERTPDEAPTLLVFGGSQGARVLNEAVCRALPVWKTRGLRLQAIHATGEADLERVRQAYRENGFEAEVTPFLEDMAGAYRRADLAVTRAGALTVMELMIAGVPAVLIPLPAGADRHQEANAEAAGQAAKILPQGDLETHLAPNVESLLRDPCTLRAMSDAGRARAKPDAGRAIAQLCLSISRGEKPVDRIAH